MNIFFVSTDPGEAAAMLCDKHIGKMLIESAQLMSTAWHSVGRPVGYKPTHQNHPCAVWTRLSDKHYAWVLEHAKELGAEWRRRFVKQHATEVYVLQQLDLAFPGNGAWIQPPQCMPEEFRQSSTVEAYRHYYRNKSLSMVMKWSDPATAPSWF